MNFSRFSSPLSAAGLLLALASFAVAQTTAPPAPPAMTPAQAEALAENATAPLPAPAVAANPDAHIGLTDNVMQALMDDPELSSLSITVNTMDDGTVSLNGVVDTQSIVDRAVSTAKSVPGVNKVVSRILVNQDPFAAQSSSIPGPTVSRSDTASDAVMPAVPGPKAKVQAALTQDPVLGPRVSAEVNGNELALIGSVPSLQAELRAVAIAKQAAPSYHLRNFIYVDAHPLAPPPLVPR